jgi:glycosyltransferase involved in cell wall biosynthesis
MKILLVEPFFTGSHKAWAEEFQQHSSHEVELLTMSGHHWKWRMHGGAVTLARKFNEENFSPDFILATDMLDFSTFLALTKSRTANIPNAIYFHENQLAYPWSETDQDVQKGRDNHYAFINYTSALVADRVFFNSQYNLSSFTDGLVDFLNAFPDHNERASIENIKAKSSVLPLGLNLQKLDKYKPATITREIPLILWNHRWEYDKNPTDFFNALLEIQEKGHEFNVAVLGENYAKSPSIFNEAKERLGEKMVHFGYADNFETYVQWLWQADIIPVTSNQDFFGASLVQAMFCNTFPLLPNRLAFPEHLPETEKDHYFYADYNELVSKLEQAIINIEQVRKTNVQQWIAQYDWSSCIDLYDTVLEQKMHTS